MSYINGNRIIKVYIPTYLDLDTVYPVGSVYISVNSTSPASLFGGTWERISSKFLLGTDDLANIGNTGGEETHVLTVNEMPQHNHSHVVATRNNNDHEYWGLEPQWQNTRGGSQVEVDNLVTQPAGGDQAHNNMPPYIKVAIWKRTA